jgi:hypothetical protein
MPNLWRHQSGYCYLMLSVRRYRRRDHGRDAASWRNAQDSHCSQGSRISWCPKATRCARSAKTPKRTRDAAQAPCCSVRPKMELDPLKRHNQAPKIQAEMEIIMYERLLNKYAINQVAYYVEDVEKAARAHNELFGSGPFFYLDNPMTPDKTIFRGEEITLTMALAYGAYKDLQIEMIQVLSDSPNVYTEMGHYGFHHFSTWVDDFDGALKDFANAGFEPAQIMYSGGGLKIAYVDCRAVWGHYVEIHNPQPTMNNINKKMAAVWDGSNPYIKASEAFRDFG